MRIVGFGQEDTKKETVPKGHAAEERAAVRSLVSVHFDGEDRERTYYNDRFDLQPGDRVFVSGKQKGKPGTVGSVTTRFRIRLSDYDRVLSVAQAPVHGRFSPRGAMMLSYDPDTLSPEDFRKWVLPPEEKTDGAEDEIVYGEGYEIPLDAPVAAEGFDPDVLDRAVGYVHEDRIGYVSVRRGVGRAFVRGTRWYETEFVLKNGMITEAYCECPFPGLCKHLLAVTVLLGALNHHGDIDLEKDFTMIEAGLLWNMVCQNDQDITL